MQNLREREESKYSAEEKAVDEDEEAFKKSVQERKQEIEKRLSEERRIPASSQRQEITEEVTSMKRQSLVEEKVKDGTFVEKPRNIEQESEPSITIKEVDKKVETSEKDQVKTKTTITKTTVTTTKDLPIETTKTKKMETVEIVKTTEQPGMSELEQKLANQKMKIERTVEDKPQITTTITTTIVETRTKDIDDTHKPEGPTAQERRDSELFEGVTQELEKLDAKKKPAPKPKAAEGNYMFYYQKLITFSNMRFCLDKFR